MAQTFRPGGPADPFYFKAGLLQQALELRASERISRATRETILSMTEELGDTTDRRGNDGQSSGNPLHQKHWECVMIVLGSGDTAG